MGAGRYHQSAEYRRKAREGKKSFESFIAVMFSPLLLIFWPFLLFRKDKKKKRRK